MNRFDPKPVSRDQYKSLIDASYQGTNDGANTAAKQGFTMDRDLSNRKQKVYLDANKNPHVVFTGTRTLGDVVTDAALAVGLGRFTQRFQDSKKIVKKVKEKYGREVTASGHSLGGSLAEYSGAKKVITLDKGVGLGDIGRRIKKNQTDIRTTTDPVSALALTQHGGKKVKIANSSFVSPLYAHDKRHIRKLDKSVRL
jgi:hypothetical protein